MTTYDHPLKWLLAELPSYVPPDRLDDLLTRYAINKRRYERQIKIRRAERIIRVYTRRDNPRDAPTIARWQAKLAALKGETT